MNTPLFEKITFDKVDTYHIKEVCQAVDLGSFPAYVELGDNPADQFLTNFEQALKELGIHPRFPYPIYIITTQIKYHYLFPILSSISELPSFFKKKNFPLKDSQVSNKNYALNYKLRSSNIYQKEQTLKEFALKHKIIFHNSKEIDFYRQILKCYKENYV